MSTTPEAQRRILRNLADLYAHIVDADRLEQQRIRRQFDELVDADPEGEAS